MIAICLAVIIVTLSILYSYITRVKHVVPGPPKWPVFGCLFQIESGRLHNSFDRWAKQYGPIFLCKMAAMNVFVINCPRLIKKAYAEKGYSNVMNDRPDSFFGNYLMDGFKGVIFGKYGQNYIRLRKMMHKCLKMYGAGVQEFEKIAHSELVAVIKTISDLEGKDFDPKELLSRSLTNLIGTLLTGSAVNENDGDLIFEYNNNLNDILEMSTETVLSALPFLRFMPLEVGRRYRRTLKSKKKLLDKYFFSHKETYVPGHERGLIDALFKLQSQEKSDETQWLTDSQLKAFIQDIIVAGLITTTNSLYCILLVLLHHHDSIDKMYQEIVEVVGLERSPSLSDRPAMPYTEALIIEALRYVTNIPLPAPHGVVEDMKFEGYFIPKGSMIFANLWTAHHDPAIWGDPWVFRPERFIDVDGKLLPIEHTLRQSLLTFGIGKRSCVGENLARSRMFLYLTTLVQTFDLLLPKLGTVPSHDPRTFLPGVVMLPQDYKMQFRVR